MGIKKMVKASEKEDYGDTVVCCTVCGRIAIGEKGEDFAQTVCVDCGNNEWKILPFAKEADVRQDPNDAEVAQACIRKRIVDASYTHREMFDEVVMSGKYPGALAKIERLAQLIYANDCTMSKKDCAAWALEKYEEMTGRFFDPTQEQFDDIVDSII